MEDLKILWIDDSKEWFQSTAEILQMRLEQEDINVRIDYENNGKSFLRAVKNVDGFKNYDLFIIDYSLSNGIVGDEIISTIRNKEVFSDIIFYSASKENELHSRIKNNISLIDGVTLANKENINDKIYKVVCKIIQRSRSINNIRGFLANATSENDFRVNSYLLENFSKLDLEKNRELYGYFLEFEKENIDTILKTYDEDKKQDRINNINLFLKRIDIPLQLRYGIVQKVAQYIDDAEIQKIDIDQYFSKIVKRRNDLAHKKIEVCNESKYLIYSDNSRQYQNRKCDNNCASCDTTYKISIEEWEEIKKLCFKYDKLFSILSSKK